MISQIHSFLLCKSKKLNPYTFLDNFQKSISLLLIEKFSPTQHNYLRLNISSPSLINFKFNKIWVIESHIIALWLKDLLSQPNARPQLLLLVWSLNNENYDWENKTTSWVQTSNLIIKLVFFHKTLCIMAVLKCLHCQSYPALTSFTSHKTKWWGDNTIGIPS